MRLGEVAEHHAGAESPGAVMGDRFAGEEAQEVALAGSVGAEHCDALAVDDLRVERVGEAVDLELLADDHPVDVDGTHSRTPEQI